MAGRRGPTGAWLAESRDKPPAPTWARTTLLLSVSDSTFTLLHPWTPNCTPSNPFLSARPNSHNHHSKSLKVADLKDLLVKANEKVTGKANKADLIAKIIASPAAVDAYRKQYEGGGGAVAGSTHADDLVRVPCAPLEPCRTLTDPLQLALPEECVVSQGSPGYPKLTNP